jgi:SAM-dependent methyltransferase
MSNVIRGLRGALRRYYYRSHLSDSIDLLLGRRDSLTPPWRIIHDSSHSLDHFKSQIPVYLKEVRQLGLKPSDNVLDVGCGNGKLGIALTNYLTAEGSYDGFDIVATAINWCSENITPKYPNFRFQHADVHNTHYNPRGKYKASEYKFPYNAETFDFVQLGSLFTHLIPESMDHYLAEIAQVLKPNGICMITYYLLTPTSLRGIEAGWATPKFPFTYGSEVCRVANNGDPEHVVAYDEDYVRGIYLKHGLQVEEPIVYGTWWWGDRGKQDIVKGVKKSSRSNGKPPPEVLKDMRTR